MKNKFFIAIVFLLPLIFILSLAILHRIEPFNIITSENIAQPEKLHETQLIWNRHDCSLISTNTDFLERLKNIPIVGSGIDVTTQQQETIRQALINLTFANFSGDYTAYWKFLAPETNYVISNGFTMAMSNYFVKLFPDRPVPDSFEQMDKQIWDHDFSNHPYWIAMDTSEIYVTLFETNLIPFLDDGQIYGNEPKFMFGSNRQCYVSYDNALNNILLKNGKLVVATILAFVKTTDLPQSPRPFIYVLAEDPYNNTWLPIEMGSFSTQVLKYNPRF